MSLWLLTIAVVWRATHNYCMCCDCPTSSFHGSKGIVSVCFRCPARTVGFFGTRLYLCIYNQQLSDAQVLPTSWLGGSTRRLQPGGHMHKEAVHLLSLQLASITRSGAFKPERNDLSQFREDTGGPSMPVGEFNLIACPLVHSSWNTPFQTWI